MSEAGALTALALRSKAYWGYSAAFMEACQEELTVTGELIEAGEVIVAEVGTDIVAFAALVGAAVAVERAAGEGDEDREAELGFFFVEPAFMRRTVGTRLWQAVVAEAKRREIRAFKVLSDPGAEAFYLKMGARRIGTGWSSLRELPLLEYVVG